MNKQYSCADCHLQSCNSANTRYPSFCISNKYLDVYENGKIDSYTANSLDHKVAIVSSELVMENYGELNRIQEIIEFSQRMHFKKIGVVMCLGLMDEGHKIATLLRENNFDVIGVGCKVGELSRAKVGIKIELIEKQNNPLCNPILQAQIMNDEDVELNVIVGLCVGHDSLFIKYANAICTTAIVKDRVHSNNPSLAL